MNNSTNSARAWGITTFVLWATTAAWAATIYWFSREQFGGNLTAWLLREVLAALHVELAPGDFAMLHLAVRKLAHVTEYFIFTLLVYGSISKEKNFRWRARTAFWSMAIAVLYAGTDEFHQRFVPGRGSSFFDVMMDAFGAALALVALYVWSRLFPEKESTPAANPASVAET